MARTGRKISAYGYYHIMLQGVNRQNIFLDDSDRSRFLDTLKRFSKEIKIDVITYCLMTNHVHLLIKALDGLDLFMKKLSTSYVYYFNHKYGRIGHLFQDRFKSEAIESDGYLITAARYILQNPQKAGICRVQDYPWSSWNDTAYMNGFTKPQILYDIAAGHYPLLDYLLTENDDTCLDIVMKTPLSEIEARKLIQQIIWNIAPKAITDLTIEERKKIIGQMKDADIPVKLIEQYTGISRNIIYKI